MVKKSELKEDLQGLTSEQFAVWELEECNLDDFKKRHKIK